MITILFLLVNSMIIHWWFTHNSRYILTWCNDLFRSLQRITFYILVFHYHRQIPVGNVNCCGCVCRVWLLRIRSTGKFLQLILFSGTRNRPFHNYYSFLRSRYKLPIPRCVPYLRYKHKSSVYCLRHLLRLTLFSTVHKVKKDSTNT